MTIIQTLAAEHVVFHNVFDHIEQTVAGLKTVAEVRAVAALLEALLKVHSRIEDHLLIEPLEPNLIQLGQHENFHAEHEQIDADLIALAKVRRVTEARKLLLGAVLASRKHFDKEERIVFPLARRLLTAKTLTALGKRWREERQAIAAEG